MEFRSCKSDKDPDHVKKTNKLLEFPQKKESFLTESVGKECIFICTHIYLFRRYIQGVS